MGLLQFIAARFFRSGRPNSASEDPRHKLGVIGEKLAEKYLRKAGYKILHRNFKPKGGGELDIVCRDGNVLAFVEVKTRASNAFGRPADAVTIDKRELIARGARAWMRLLDKPETVIRFDVVEVLMSEPTPKITLTKAAFVPQNTRV